MKAIARDAVSRINKKGGPASVKKALRVTKKKAPRAQVVEITPHSLGTRGSVAVLPDADASSVPDVHPVHNVVRIRRSLNSSAPIYAKLVSPEVQRSTASGKLVVVTEKERAERRQKAEKLGLKWYV